MADVNINIFTNKVYKQGASTVVPGFIEGEEPTPINPSGSGGASEFVPYIGANESVDLGEFGLSAGFLKLDTTPTNTPTDQGTMYWDEDDNTVDIILNGYIMKVGEDLFYPVKNQTGSSIAKGTNVGFAGTLGMSGRLLITPYLANGANPTSRYMGVTAETIANGDDGKVLWFGRIRGINTNAFNEGDILYASTSSAGAFQTTLPVAPNNIVEVAAVVTKSVNNGVIFVRPQFLSSASIGGSGTTNYVARFTGASTIGNSQIIDNGTNVLINKTVDNGNKLQLNGNFQISSGDIITDNLRGLYYDNDNRVRIDSGYGWEISSWSKTLFKKNVEIENQIYSPVNAKGNSGSGTVTFNWNDSNIQSVTLTGNCTFAFSNPQSGASYQIIVSQDGTGGRVVTLPSVTWQGGSAPSLPTGINNQYLLRFYYNGSAYFGELVGYYSGGAYLTDAPSDSKSYARKNGAWDSIQAIDVEKINFPSSYSSVENYKAVFIAGNSIEAEGYGHQGVGNTGTAYDQFTKVYLISSTTTGIVNSVNAREHDEIVVVNTSASSKTLKHNAVDLPTYTSNDSFIFNSGADYSLPSKGAIKFIRVDSKWREYSKS
jgi:hypothetical protein